MQQGDIAAEMERARVDFHHLLDNATSAELRAGTDGTKWTNEQLLFHMLFGYLLVHNLLILVKAFTRLPRRVSKAFAATLNAATRPFHVVNYLGSLGGARALGHARMERLMDVVIGRLQRSVRAASEEGLNRDANSLWQRRPRRRRMIGYPRQQVVRNSAETSADELPKTSWTGSPAHDGAGKLHPGRATVTTREPAPEPRADRGRPGRSGPSSGVARRWARPGGDRDDTDYTAAGK
jgi:hypothetical protein